MKVTAYFVFISFISISTLAASSGKVPVSAKSAQVQSSGGTAIWANPTVWIFGAIAALSIWRIWQEHSTKAETSGCSQESNKPSISQSSSGEWIDADAEPDTQ